MTRRKALLGCVPTALLLMLALIVPSTGIASASEVAALDEPTTTALDPGGEAEAGAAGEGVVEPEAYADEATDDTLAGTPASQPGAEPEITDDGEIVDNKPTLDNERTDAAGNVIEDGVTNDEATVAGAVRIMPLGDSITRGVGQPIVNGAYRPALEDQLVAKNYAFDFVGPRNEGPSGLNDKDHAGFGGNTIAGNDADESITDRVVNEGLITSLDPRPDIILLTIGTNDIDGDNRGDIPIEQYRTQAPARLKNLITEIVADAPAAIVYVSSIPPQSEKNADGEVIDHRVKGPATRAYNAAILDVVDDFGSKVRYVNVGGSLGLDDLRSDGKHPNGLGNTEMATAWAAIITGTSPPTSTPPTSTPQSNCPAGKTRNSKGKCVTTSTSSTSSTSTTSTTRPTTGTCPDGKKPGGKTGQCAGGVPASGASFPGEDPVTTTPSDPVACADGKKPNPKSGKCPGGVEPTLIAATAPPSDPVRCADGKLPNPKVGKCA